MCTDLFESEEIAKDITMKFLKMIALDRVVNVRVTLAKVISELYRNKNFSWILNNEDLIKIFNHLKNDSNKNVNSLFDDINDVDIVAYTEDELIDVNINFTNKMSIVKDEFGILRNLPVNAKTNLKSNTDTNSPKKSQKNKNSSINDNSLSSDTVKVEENEIDNQMVIDSETSSLNNSVKDLEIKEEIKEEAKEKSSEEEHKKSIEKISQHEEIDENNKMQVEEDVHIKVETNTENKEPLVENVENIENVESVENIENKSENVNEDDKMKIDDEPQDS